jgi:plasmid stabilization system protein ParE
MPGTRPTKVIFAKVVRHDLVEIARYTARGNPGRARSVASDLRDRALALAGHPQAFARVADPLDAGFRRLIVGSSVFVDRLQGSRAEV